MPSQPSWLARAAVALLPGAGVGGQMPAEPNAGPDPAAFARAGYVAYGPFELGDGHGTIDVDGQNRHLQALWLETAHFRIGSTLAERPLPEDNAARKAIQAECRLLRKRLPRVPADPARLDPWLQVHLFAQRLEDLYADLAGRTGVGEDWFDGRANAAGRGDGRYLGCRSKFVVLLFQLESDLARYLRRHCECRIDGPWAQRFDRQDAMLFATAAECCRGRLQDPLQLHGHVVHHVVQNLVDAFVASDVTMPWWWREGLAHWYVRRIDSRLAELSDHDGSEELDTARWPERVLARVRQDLVPPPAELLHWCDGRGRSEADHALTWSLVDHLMQSGDEAFARFVRQVRDRPMRSRYMPASLVLEWHEGALRAGYGAGIEELLRRWRRHVLKTYR